MATKAIVTEPVVLDGFQAVMKPGKYGYKLEALLDDKTIALLEKDREGLIEWCKSRLKNPNRSTLKPEPWEEVAEGKYKVRFGWTDDDKYFSKVVDSEGNVLTDTSLPVYSGSKVKLAFIHKPYILKDGVTYGTSLKLKGIQIISLSSSAGVDAGDMDAEDVAELFGKTKGFKVDDPNVTPTPAADSDDDF